MSETRSLPVIRLLTGAMLLAWPLFIWFGMLHDGLRWLLPLMILLLTLRFYQARQKEGALRIVTQIVVAVAIALCLSSYLLKSYQLLLFYPVLVNGVMLCVFGGSLWSAMPIVERLARIRDPNLSTEGVQYTRRVTQIWSLFFIINGSMALFTALQDDMSLWMIWNGMISYLLMGILMVGEWLVRQRVIKRDS